MRTYTAILIAAGLTVGAQGVRAANVFNVGGFEGYTLGDVVGQGILGTVAGLPPTWVADTSNTAPGGSATLQPDPLIVNDPTLQNHGKVLAIDPAGTTVGDWSGAYLPLGDLATSDSKLVNVDFDQFRTTLNQEIFVSENVDQTGWYADEYALQTPPSLHPNGNVTNPGLPLTSGRWQHVSVALDYNTHQVTASLDGNSVGPETFRGNSFAGLDFEVFATDLGAPNGPTFIDNVSVSQGPTVPEPGTIALALTGLAPMLLRRRRRA